MKRAAAFMLTVVIGCFLSACGGERSAPIEPAAWVMSSVQRGDDGAVLYCSAGEKDLYADAEVRDIVCNINDSAIEIRNNETSEKWSGTYELLKSNDAGNIYEATIEDKEYLLVKSVTEYADGTDPRDTLILSCEDLALKFFGKE